MHGAQKGVPRRPLPAGLVANQKIGDAHMRSLPIPSPAHAQSPARWASRQSLGSSRRSAFCSACPGVLGGCERRQRTGPLARFRTSAVRSRRPVAGVIEWAPAAGEGRCLRAGLRHHAHQTTRRHSTTGNRGIS
jgi:hypothetical protein